MNRLVVGLVLSVAVLGGGCIYLSHLLRLERHEIAVLQAHLNEMQQANVSLSKPERSSASDPNENDLPPAAKSVAAAASGSGQAGHGTGKERSEPLSRAPSNDRYRNAEQRFQRVLIEQDNPDLLRVLGLSAEQGDRFLDLLAEGAIREQQAYFDKRIGTEQRRLAQQARKQLEAEVAELLGNEKLEQWKLYEASRAARDLVSQLRTAMATTGDPLRDDQADSMIASITAERQRHQADRKTLYDEGPATWANGAPLADKVAHMRRRQDAINEHFDRLEDVGRTYLDADQQQQFEVMLKRSRDYSQAEFDMWLAGEEAPSR